MSHADIQLFNLVNFDLEKKELLLNWDWVAAKKLHFKSQNQN
jgi:hypothetical protein